MSKKEFMEELEVLLGELPKEEREEAIRYYESYFEEAGADQEQVVLDELGSAGRIATQILREYRTEKGAGIYTEQGYRTEEPEKQTPVRYTEQEQATEQKTDASSGSGIYVTNKGLDGGALVAAILVAILTFPIWISILATVIGIVAGFGVGGVVCIIAGVIVFAIGIVKTFTIPVVGAALIAAGLLVIGVGCLMIAAVGGIIRLAAWVVGGLIKLLNRLFHGRKGATA